MPEKQAAQTEVENLDASIRMYEDKAKMRMAIFIDPPSGEGAHVSLEQLQKALQQKKVVYGIDQQALEQLVNERIYGEELTVATGKPVVDGTHGAVTELFPREFKPSFKERADGTIDFKEMNIVINIALGDKICEIKLPTEGALGMNIYGAEIKPRKGLAALVPMGENTKLTEDGTALIAAVDGSLVFRKGKFCVDKIYTVAENVDNSIGNITFNGDVVVKGTVQEGFTINCKGNVRVCGMVEGASIFAGGTITLDNGINGMGHGVLEAGGDITSKYIESCSIRAGGDIKAESVINCTVESDGNLIVNGKKGTIAGGKLTVFGYIQAQSIGSRSAVHTVIALGTTPSITKEKNQLEAELKLLQQENEELNKNLVYLERAEKLGQLNTPERRSALSQLRLRAPVAAMKEAKMQFRLEQLKTEMSKVKECTLTCRTLYPPLKISIGNITTTIQDNHDNCRIYRSSEGEICIGIL